MEVQKGVKVLAQKKPHFNTSSVKESDSDNII